MRVKETEKRKILRQIREDFCEAMHITEGKVNKLKTIKRQMYGRAGFPLLRQRLLHDA